MSQTDFLQQANKGIAELQPYQPGKPVDELERELGIKNSIKLASNENPLGPSPKAINVIKTSLNGLAFYPDGNGFRLKQALSAKLDVSEDMITLGNGSNEILELVAHAWLNPQAEVIFSKHAFAVYPIVSQAVGANIRMADAYPVEHASPFGHNLDAMLGLVTDSTQVIFVANPNNPTGTWLQKAELEAFINKVPENIVIVIDEAYFEYVNEDEYPNSIAFLGKYKNIIVTRTFSKIYGLAGLRIGYAVSSPDLAEVLNRIRQPFNTNSLAQEAAIAALGDTEHVEYSKQVNLFGLQQYETGFARRNINFIPSVANFITADFGIPGTTVYEKLLRKGVIVRPIANYAMPDWLRITVGNEAQNNRVLTALDQVLNAD